MKIVRTLSLFLLLLVAAAGTLRAQAPHYFTYQSSLRDSAGHILANKPIVLTVDIMRDSANGAKVYSENHAVSTNANGLFSVVVGTGATSTAYPAIDWSQGPFFLVTRVAPYDIVIRRQIVSVPYALYAESAARADTAAVALNVAPAARQLLTLSHDTLFLTGGGFVKLPASFSGSYTDLTDLPAQWDSSYASLKGVPDAWDSSYASLKGVPTIPTNVSQLTNDAGYITNYAEQQVLSIGHDTIYLTGGSFVKLPASFSGSYNDLTDLPAQWDSSYASLKGVPAAWDSSYASLKGVPTIPTNVSQLTNDAGYITNYAEQQVLSIGHDTIYLTGGSFVKLPAGFSGSYNDLTDLPAAWDSTYASLKGVPAAWDSSYVSLKGAPSIPTNVSQLANDAGYITNYAEQQVLSIGHDTIYLTGGSFVKLPAGFSGSYNDLTDLPAAWDSTYASLKGVPAQWDSSYASLKGVPTIPTNVSQLTNDAGYITSYAEQQVLSIGHDTIYLTGGSFVKLPASFSGSYNDLTDLPASWDSTYASLKGIPAAWDSSYSSLKGVPAVWDSTYASLKGIPAAWDSTYASLKGVPAAWDSTYASLKGVPAAWDSSYASIKGVPAAWDSSYASLKGVPTIPTNVSQLTNDAGYITNYAEQQNISDVMAINNNAGGKQLKGLDNPTDSQDAVTYILLKRVEDAIARVNARADSLSDALAQSNAAFQHAVDSLENVIDSINALISCVPTTSSDTLRGTVGQTLTITLQDGDLDTIFFAVGKYAVVETGLTNAAGCDSTAKHFMEVSTVASDDGCLPGEFSVSATTKVKFSMGNLQYTTTGTHAVAYGGTAAGTWRFAEHQWDYVGSPANAGDSENATPNGTVSGSDNVSASSSYTGWIDLFGWGTSGYHNSGDSYNTNYYPYSTDISTVNESYSKYGYGPSTNMTDANLTGTSANYDWGVYNAISNGGDAAGQWRTLTQSEWDYLFYTRTDASSKYGQATVNGVQCVVLLPDSWTLPSGLSFTAGKSGGYTNNTYDASQWALMEAAGAVLLPAAGYRSGSSVHYAGQNGSYWSSTAYNSARAYYLYFSSGYLYASYYYDGRNFGQAVRLVRRDAAAPTVVTDSVSSITTTSAVVHGSVADDGGAEVTEVGFCYSTSADPATSGTKKTLPLSTTGVYTDSVSLMANTTYYFCFYATNSLGTTYGTVQKFTSDELSLPSVAVDGCLPGEFSVSATTKVKFSQGNLQYTTTGTHAVNGGGTDAGTWRFAEHQWYYVGSPDSAGINNNLSPNGTVRDCDNKDASSSYTGWIDLFCWGTSGWNSGAHCYYPYSTSNAYNDYYTGGDYSNNLTGSYANADWGVYNAISNGGDAAGQWRTLTTDEWKYLINSRTDASSRYGQATVAGVQGTVLLPDSWSLPLGLTFTAGAYGGYLNNTYTALQWVSMEAAGAVFLPAAGYRNGTSVNGAGEHGYYWSSTAYTSNYACGVYFSDGGFNPSLRYSNRMYGQSVRLVR